MNIGLIKNSLSQTLVMFYRVKAHYDSENLVLHLSSPYETSSGAAFSQMERINKGKWDILIIGVISYDVLCIG